MPKYQIYKSENQGEQCWHWRFIGNGGEIIANSDKPFFKGDIIASVKRIRQETPEASIKENGSSGNQGEGFQFEYHKNDKDKQWNWHLLDGNHKIVAVGKVLDLENSIERYLEDIRKEMGDAKITWEDPKDDPDCQAKHDDQTETKGIPGS